MQVHKYVPSAENLILIISFSCGRDWCITSNFLKVGFTANNFKRPLLYPTAEIKGSSKDSLLGISHAVGLTSLFKGEGSSNKIFWGNDFILEAKEHIEIFLSAP